MQFHRQEQPPWLDNTEQFIVASVYVLYHVYQVCSLTTSFFQDMISLVHLVSSSGARLSCWLNKVCQWAHKESSPDRFCFPIGGGSISQFWFIKSTKFSQCRISFTYFCFSRDFSRVQLLLRFPSVIVQTSTLYIMWCNSFVWKY